MASAARVVWTPGRELEPTSPPATLCDRIADRRHPRGAGPATSGEPAVAAIFDAARCGPVPGHPGQDLRLHVVRGVGARRGCVHGQHRGHGEGAAASISVSWRRHEGRENGAVSAVECLGLPWSGELRGPRTPQVRLPAYRTVFGSAWWRRRPGVSPATVTLVWCWRARCWTTWGWWRAPRTGKEIEDDLDVTRLTPQQRHHGAAPPVTCWPVPGGGGGGGSSLEQQDGGGATWCGIALVAGAAVMMWQAAPGAPGGGGVTTGAGRGVSLAAATGRLLIGCHG